jgi:glutamate racemase
MSKYKPIAVFDSGLGSLAVVRMLMHELPRESIVYFADRANHPYGAKSRQELKSIIANSIDMLINEYEPKCIVVASITPSLLVLDELRLNRRALIFGTYPCIDKAFTLSKSKSIAILASKAVVKSNELDEIFKGYISRGRFTAIDASKLISFVENGTFLTSKDKGVIEDACSKIKDDPSIDTILLGSTHLSFLEDSIKEFFPNVTIVNPVVYTVARVKEYLTNHDMLIDSSIKGSLNVLVSKDEHEFASILAKMNIVVDDVKVKQI